MLPGALQDDTLPRTRGPVLAPVGVIRTQRLLLRPARLTDLEPLHTVFSDPRAMRYWSRPAHEDITQTREMLHFLMEDRPGQVEFAIECDGRCIGRAGIWRDAEIGYILHPGYWGQGLTFEALSALIPEIARRRPDLDRLTAEVDPRNTGSVRLLEKLGFTLVRTEEKNFLYGGWEWCDSAYYERTLP
ncbi:GNAT family N-acetyltransferase [uncultured Mameliella sp.]|uniref:GNAT family N-acetyltransferase n=1 Tax=uncultured Mameliella sp. TaxID=1447087 RepID=UPI0026109941|nr:GNAT family N-acetyltransferase [uncultured Mameliella sp.]